MELILELTGWRRSITEIISSNIIGPFPKESDNPSKKVGQTSGYLDDTKKSLVFTTVRFPKKGILTWLTKKGKQNLMW